MAQSKTQPIVKSLPWLLPNSLECIKDLNDTLIYEKDVILVAADVESMYTNIDLQEALPSIFYTFLVDKCDNYLIIGALLEWVLKTITPIQGHHLSSNQGYSNGRQHGPGICKPIPRLYELEWKNNPLFPTKYYRYLDDILFVYTAGEQKLGEWCKLMNSTSPSLKFTFEKGKKVSFLDLEISVGQKHARTFQLDYNLFDKPTNKHLYTDPTTYQPNNYRFSWITGENIRLIRNSDSEAKYNQNIQAFIKYLRNRNYRGVALKNIKHTYSHRSQFLTTSSKKVLEGKPIFIKNEAGRHILQKHISNVVNGFNKPKTPIIVLKGENLQDNFNKVNKKLLSGDNLIRNVRQVCYNTSTMSHLQKHPKKGKGRK